MPRSEPVVIAAFNGAGTNLLSASYTFDPVTYSRFDARPGADAFASNTLIDSIGVSACNSPKQPAIIPIIGTDAQDGQIAQIDNSELGLPSGLESDSSPEFTENRDTAAAKDVNSVRLDKYGKPIPAGFGTPEARAKGRETQKQIRSASKIVPDFIEQQGDIYVKSWRYHSARFLKGGPKSQESRKALDDMRRAYAPSAKDRSNQDEATDRAPQYAGLPEDAYALAVACDATIGEIVHRDRLGLPLSDTELLIAETCRDYVMGDRERAKYKAARERLARINRYAARLAAKEITPCSSPAQ